MRPTRMTIIAVLLAQIVVSTVRAENVRFAVLADSQGTSETAFLNEEVFSEIVDRVLQMDPPVQFVVVVGDLVWGIGDDEQHRLQLERWRELAEPWYQSDMIGAKVYTIPGNHDVVYRDTYVDIWQSVFPELPDNGPDDEKKLNYSFDVGPCHLVAVSTSSPGTRHLVNVEWLAEDLEGTDAPIVFVFGHEPAYPRMFHIGWSLDVYPSARDEFWQVLVDHGVQAYFSGHEHLFDHWMKDGVHQIISGGGGGAGLGHHFLVVDADEEDVTISAYRPDGELRRRYKLSEMRGVATDDRSSNERSFLVGLFAPCLPVFAVFLITVALAFGGLSGGSGRFDGAPSIRMSTQGRSA